ncbi:hypothetical protein [uncultured Methylophaga sp.]|uniref:hypothetical protein n=1 Tax=uncultured Methylophaga sp. TaxID=285271 RepID=UPI00260739C5|nr:hypothetical protein [uncultured Methylophaga sp.]
MYYQQTTATAVHSELPRQWGGPGLPGWLVIFAIAYNAILAFINAHLMSLSSAHVAITEALVLAGVMLFLLPRLKQVPDIRPHILFLLGMCLLSFWVMLSNEATFIKIVRDCLIMVAFLLLGTFLSSRNIIFTFKILMAAVLSVAAIEIFATEAYVWLFEPEQYFFKTRGIEPFEYSDSGLFRNSLGYSSRFSFNFLSSHRISSLFLEQVSLANFAMVTLIFLMGFSQQMGKKAVLFFLLGSVFLILTNDTRTGALFALAMIPCFYLSPLFPRWFAVTFIPVLLLLSTVLFYDPSQTSLSDSFAGRIGFTLYLLSEADLPTLLTGNLAGIHSVADSGYSYLIYATSLFGLILFWLYVALVVRSDQPASKRYVFAMNGFIAVNLMIGAAVFTIKIAAPMWMMMGYLYKQANLPDKRGAGS